MKSLTLRNLWLAGRIRVSRSKKIVLGKMKKIYRIVYGIFVLAVIVIASLFIVTLFPIPGNFQVKIVQSGSMEPAIKTGGVVIVKPVKNYSVGDVVTFGKDTKIDVPTTHRIINSRVAEGSFLFTTKGDANEDKDTKEIREQEIIGKVFFSVPFAGYVLAVAKKPLGFAVLIIVPSLIILFDEGKKVLVEIKKIKQKKENETPQ